MLTMDVDKEHIPEVKVDPCSPAKAAPKGVVKKSTGTAPKKKK